jgi:hypothetical protein
MRRLLVTLAALGLAAGSLGAVVPQSIGIWSIGIW